LFSELNESNATLKDALDQQTAVSEILGSMSRSPGDLATVLQAVVERAAALCAADNATIRLVEGDQSVVAAHHLGELAKRYPEQRGFPIGTRGSIAGPTQNSLHNRALRTGRTIHLPDLAQDEVERHL